MKYKMKQIIALIMALAVCVGLISVPLFSVKAQAADTTFKTVTNSKKFT